MQFTLKELLEKHQIVVPQIQRDYAQGRDSELDLRKGFIKKIKHSLEQDGLPLNLDFIYGYTEKIGNDSNAFIPLDGQQRLSTLWLLYWYLAPRDIITSDTESISTITKEAQDYLKAFTYETRTSSKRFCHSLICNSLPFGLDIELSKLIKDAPWFMASWNNDPTVVSMLNMLDTIHGENFEKDLAWKNLLKNRMITFDYIDIKSDEFKLTDELYIKMNSRGKPLTSFENLKAQFSDLLSSKKTDYVHEKLTYQKAHVTYQQYFSFNIDSIWMDLFWKYRTKVDIKIDDCFFNFIFYTAEFLYFKDNVNETSSEVKYDFDFLNRIFSVKKNVDFLFSSLDFLANLPDINAFFNDLFNDLSTFDNYPKDYFLRAVSNAGFIVKDKVIFYSILAYCINTQIKSPDDELKNFLRIVRNLLLAVRQPNQSKRIEYTTNLRLPNVSEYCKFIDEFIKLIGTKKEKTAYEIFTKNEFSGFTKENIGYEKLKASLINANPKLKQSLFSLEEHPYIQGNTSNFKLHTNDLIKKIAAFHEIWNKDVENSLLIRAFLSVGNFSVITHEYSSLGRIRYFGSPSNWNRIITATDKEEREKVSDNLDSFLVTYIAAKGNTVVDKLCTLLINYKSISRDWIYYFIKYESIINNPFRNLNLFAWSDNNGFDITTLGNSGNLPLHSYHLNPYLIVIKQNFKDNDKIKLDWGRFTEKSSLRIAENINFNIYNEGWKISPINNYVINKNLITMYNLKQQDESYILTETDKKDRIEIAIELIEDILKS